MGMHLSLELEAALMRLPLVSQSKTTRIPGELLIAKPAESPVPTPSTPPSVSSGKRDGTKTTTTTATHRPKRKSEKRSTQSRRQLSISKRKFNNAPVILDGLRFDSKKEGQRWLALIVLKRFGSISCLRRQVRIPVAVNGVVVCRYVADFVYLENGQRIVEDVKSRFTRTLPVYRLKMKLLKALYGIEIRET